MKQLLAALGLLVMSEGPAFASPSLEMIDLPLGKTTYTDQGEGDPLVLIHGLGADLTRWNANIELLAATHRVIALDLYGFGASERLEGDYRAQFFVEQIEDLRRALDLEDLTLIGNSMGGWVSMLYAERYPNSVDRLILVAPAFVYGLPETVTANQLSGGADPETLDEMAAYLSRVYAHPPTDPAEIAAWLDMHQTTNTGDAISSMAASIARGDDAMTIERIAAIETPTLVIHGVEDGVAPIGVSEQIASTLPDSEFIAYGNAGHWPQEEAADAFNRDVLRFLTD